MYFFQFNTGRSYSDNGQIIKCLLDEDSSAEVFHASIWFVDTTREVAGKIFDTVCTSSERVMSCYDSLNYEELLFENFQIQKILKHNFYMTGPNSTKEDIGVQINASGDVVINEPLRKVRIAGITVFTNSSNDLFVELPNKRIYRMMNWLGDNLIFAQNGVSYMKE